MYPSVVVNGQGALHWLTHFSGLGLKVIKLLFKVPSLQHRQGNVFKFIKYALLHLNLEMKISLERKPHHKTNQMAGQTQIRSMRLIY